MLKRNYRNKKYCVKKQNHKRGILFISFVFSLVIIISMVSTGTKRREFISSANIIREGLKADELDLGSLSSSKKLLCDTLIKQLGKPYAYGKDGPDRFDCSGLVEYVYSQIGIKLPRIVVDQANAGKRIYKNELRFGDIVFFSKNGISLNHAGIYIGRGYMIHSPKTGDVVKISTIASGYYAEIFKGAVRVIKNTQPQNFHKFTLSVIR